MPNMMTEAQVQSRVDAYIRSEANAVLPGDVCVDAVGEALAVLARFGVVELTHCRWMKRIDSWFYDEERAMALAYIETIQDRLVALASAA